MVTVIFILHNHRYKKKLFKIQVFKNIKIVFILLTLNVILQNSEIKNS